MVIKDNSFSNSLHRLGDVLDRCSGPFPITYGKKVICGIIVLQFKLGLTSNQTFACIFV